MGKRKRERDEDYIIKRIKKLEERLRSRRRHDETDSESAWDHEENPTPSVVDSSSIIVRESTPVEDENTANPLPVGTTPTVEEDITLDEEFLTLLGDAPKEESPKGPEVQKDIAARLRDVIKNGLKKEQKDKILEDYPFPANCEFFQAPILNPEIKAAVSDLLQKKDASIEARQKQIGVALTSLCRALNILVLEKSTQNQILVKHISNASRLLCDSHCIDTKLRRNFLVSTLNSKLKETLKDTKRDKFLFGEDLSETLKATKAISKSSQDLKNLPTRTKPSTTRSHPTSSQNFLNLKSPHPGVQNKKPVPLNHRATGWSPQIKSQARRAQSQPSAARGTARYKPNVRRT